MFREVGFLSRRCTSPGSEGWDSCPGQARGGKAMPTVLSPGQGWSLAARHGCGPPCALSPGAPRCLGEAQDSPGGHHERLWALAASQILCVFDRSLTVSGPLRGSRVKPGTCVPPRLWGRWQALTDGWGHRPPRASSGAGRQRVDSGGLLGGLTSGTSGGGAVWELSYKRVKDREQLPGWLDSSGLRSRHGKAGSTLGAWSSSGGSRRGEWKERTAPPLRVWRPPHAVTATRACSVPGLWWRGSQRRDLRPWVQRSGLWTGKERALHSSRRGRMRLQQRRLGVPAGCPPAPTGEKRCVFPVACGNVAAGPSWVKPVISPGEGSLLTSPWQPVYDTTGPESSGGEGGFGRSICISPELGGRKAGRGAGSRSPGLHHVDKWPRLSPISSRLQRHLPAPLVPALWLQFPNSFQRQVGAWREPCTLGSSQGSW